MTNEDLSNRTDFLPDNLPNNVKQIGSITGDSRIYMEDYASTYLEQYAHSCNNSEKVAVLVGRNLTINNDNVLFISGVIQGKYTIQKNGMVELTEKSWQYIEKQLKLYFKDLQVVGWAYVQPGFEDYISEKLCNFQKNNLTKGFQVLYISDPAEKITGFYRWNNNDSVFNNINGYIIYYEKNDGMHEYMLENKIKEDKPEKAEKDAGAVARKITESKRPIKPKHYSQDQTKSVGLLGSVSFVMLLVCFIMGAGLVQNDEKITALEAQVAALESQFQDSMAVFAIMETQATTEITTQPTTQQMQQSTQATAKSEYNKYTVQIGDTLIGISKAKYGDASQVAKIKELNKMSDDNIVVGKTILLP